MCVFVSDDSFDPVIIADKLRTIADALNNDERFKTALGDLKSEAAQEVRPFKASIRLHLQCVGDVLEASASGGVSSTHACVV